MTCLATWESRTKTPAGFRRRFRILILKPFLHNLVGAITSNMICTICIHIMYDLMLWSWLPSTSNASSSAGFHKNTSHRSHSHINQVKRSSVCSDQRLVFGTCQVGLIYKVAYFKQKTQILHKTKWHSAFANIQNWLTHCRTKHDYLSMVKSKSMHFSRSDEVDFQFVLQPPTLSFVVSKTMFPGHVDKTHARPKGGTSLGKSPLWFWWHRYPPFARWRHEPPGMNLSQPVLWMTSSVIKKSVRMEYKTKFHRKTLQSRPRLVYLWSSQTLCEGHPQKRSPEYSSRIYLSLCPGCQKQLCDCSKTLLGQRLKPHVLVNFPALIHRVTSKKKTTQGKWPCQLHHVPSWIL